MWPSVDSTMHKGCRRAAKYMNVSLAILQFVSDKSCDMFRTTKLDRKAVDMWREEVKLLLLKAAQSCLLLDKYLTGDYWYRAFYTSENKFLSKLHEVFFYDHEASSCALVAIFFQHYLCARISLSIALENNLENIFRNGMRLFMSGERGYMKIYERQNA